MNSAPDDALIAAVDPNALRYQEILFSFVMGVAALLGRESPLVRSPELLWVLASMLAFNLGYHRALRRGGPSSVPLLSMGVNVGFIALTLACSGGSRSSFWPVFLLPIFTACLHLQPRHVAEAVAGAAAVLSWFHLAELRSWEACELGVKVALLSLAAAVIAQLAFKERGQRAALAAERARVEALAAALERRSASDLLDLKRRSLETLLPGIAHALNNPLSIVLGSVELLLGDEPGDSQRRRDLERIRAAAARCASIGEDLLAYGRSAKGERCGS